MNLLALQSILAASRKTEAPSTPPLTRDDIRSMARLEPSPVIVSVDTMRRLCEPDPLLAPIPPAALAALGVPTPAKKNRAQRRKEAHDGR